MPMGYEHMGIKVPKNAPALSFTTEKEANQTSLF
jgi:hypothetical protein